MEDSLYDELWRTEHKHWWFVARRNIVRSLVDRHAPETDDDRLSICELGCGTGGNIASFAEKHDVVGVDTSEHALRYARKRLGDHATYGRLPDDVRLTPSSFDVVLATDVFEHIEDDVKSVETALSLLRPGGILVATVPAYQWLFSPRDIHHQHFRRYGRRQFEQLFDVPDVRLELLSHYNTVLFPPAALARQLSKWLPQESLGDLRVPPRPVNAILTWLFTSERRLLERTTLPFGLSLVAVARRLRSPAEQLPDVTKRQRAA